MPTSREIKAMLQPLLQRRPDLAYLGGPDLSEEAGHSVAAAESVHGLLDVVPGRIILDHCLLRTAGHPAHLEGLFPGGRVTTAAAFRGLPVTALEAERRTITLREAATGVTKEVKIRRRATCGTCTAHSCTGAAATVCPHSRQRSSPVVDPTSSSRRGTTRPAPVALPTKSPGPLERAGARVSGCRSAASTDTRILHGPPRGAGGAP